MNKPFSFIPELAEARFPLTALSRILCRLSVCTGRLDGATAPALLSATAPALPVAQTPGTFPSPTYARSRRYLETKRGRFRAGCAPNLCILWARARTSASWSRPARLAASATGAGEPTHPVRLQGRGTEEASGRVGKRGAEWGRVGRVGRAQRAAEGQPAAAGVGWCRLVSAGVGWCLVSAGVSWWQLAWASVS